MSRKSGQMEALVAKLKAEGRVSPAVPLLARTRVMVEAVEDPGCQQSVSQREREAHAKTVKYRGVKNKTEEEFYKMLEARVMRGDFLSVEYEGITLRWPKHENDIRAMTYTPDFLAVTFNGSWHTQTLIEVKGAHAWAKDVVKFRAARARWGHLYGFQFWQKIDGEWKETR